MPLAWQKEKRSKKKRWSCSHGSEVMNPTGILEEVGSIPVLTQWVMDPVLQELWCRSQARRRSSDPEVLWLWCKPVAAALI